MDFNFFEGYKKVAPKSNFVMLGIIFVLSMGFGIGIIFTVINAFDMYDYKARLESLNEVMQSENYLKSLEEYKEKDIRLKTVTIENESFGKIQMYTDYAHTSSESVFSILINEFTENLYLNKVAIIGTFVKIEGVGIDNKAIANYESNLRKSNFFNQILVNLSAVNKDFKPVEHLINKRPFEFKMEADINMSTVLGK